jgi:catechol 2,3-dioxygenase-like lactoylglutathione lyase family enzyme
MKAAHVFESCLCAEDLIAAERFYCDVLGLPLVSRMPSERGLAFRCGAGVVLVFDPRRTRIHDSHVPAHGTSGAGHLAFLVEAKDLDAWREHLRCRDVEIETEVVWPQGGRSIYFRDPAGNSIELAPPTLWGFNDGVPP